MSIRPPAEAEHIATRGLFRPFALTKAYAGGGHDLIRKIGNT
jgi:hypothetical protein